MTTASGLIGMAGQRRKKMASRDLSLSPSKPLLRSHDKQRQFGWEMALTTTYNIVETFPLSVMLESCALRLHSPLLVTKELPSHPKLNSWANRLYLVQPSILCNQFPLSHDSPRGMMLESGLSKVRPQCLLCDPISNRPHTLRLQTPASEVPTRYRASST